MIIRGDEPVIIVRRSQNGVDDYGNPTYTTQEILVRDALFSYGTTDEPVELARNPIDARLTLYLPRGVVIQPGDIFIIRETEWEKDGDPQEWQKLWQGFDPGVVITVRRRRG